MPNYTYFCLDCNKKFSVFMSFSEFDKKEVTCIYCNGKNIQRRIGLLRIAQSEEKRLEKLADPSALEGLEDDPRSLGKMMRQMSNEVGEDMGEDFGEVIDRLESGQSPEDIEKSMPDLDADADTPSFGDDF